MSERVPPIAGHHTGLALARHPAPYRPLSPTCVAASTLCLGLGIARPAPLALAVALVVLFSVPWLFAVAHRVIHQNPPDLEPS
jgi:hypothetical protein